jgi:LysM repeat protein
MLLYKTQPGDSPALIAHRLGTSIEALLAANPHKPTTIVAGQPT